MSRDSFAYEFQLQMRSNIYTSMVKHLIRDYHSSLLPLLGTSKHMAEKSRGNVVRTHPYAYHLTPGVYRMTAQIREKIPPGKTCPRFYLSERRHEIWPGKNVHLDCLIAKTLIPVYFTYFPFYKFQRMWLTRVALK
jgi:hypothetical protein